MKTKVISSTESKKIISSVLGQLNYLMSCDNVDCRSSLYALLLLAADILDYSLLHCDTLKDE